MNDEKQMQPALDPKAIARYRGTMGELSNAELGVSSWYVRHRVLLRQISIGTLAVFGIGMLGFSLFQWGAYAFFGYSQDQALFLRQVRQAPNYAAIHPLYEARDLQVVRPDVFASAPGRYDFVADVTNPNERWVAIVTYQYTHSRGETELLETIVMPLATRPLVALGEEVSAFPSTPRLVITDIDWRKISAHAVPDVAAYMSERLSFVHEDVDFTAASASQDRLVHQISFDLKNNTAYSYWQPLFYVELFDGNRRVGIVPLTVEQFRSGDERRIDLSSLAEQLRVDQIELTPVINVFDAREFMEPGT